MCLCQHHAGFKYQNNALTFDAICELVRKNTPHLSVSASEISLCLVRLVSTGIIEHVEENGIVVYAYILSPNKYVDTDKCGRGSDGEMMEEMESEEYGSEGAPIGLVDKANNDDEEINEEKKMNHYHFDARDCKAKEAMKQERFLLLNELSRSCFLPSYFPDEGSAVPCTTTPFATASTASNSSKKSPRPFSLINQSLEEDVDVMKGNKLSEEKMMERIVLSVIRQQEQQQQQQQQPLESMSNQLTSHEASVDRLDSETIQRDSPPRFCDKFWSELNASAHFPSMSSSISQYTSSYTSSRSSFLFLPYPFQYSLPSSPIPSNFQLSPLHFMITDQCIGFDLDGLLKTLRHCILPDVPQSLIFAILSILQWDIHKAVDIITTSHTTISKVLGDIVHRVNAMKELIEKEQASGSSNICIPSCHMNSHTHTTLSSSGLEIKCFLFPPLQSLSFRWHFYSSALFTSPLACPIGPHLHHWPVNCEAMDEWVQGREKAMDNVREGINGNDLVTLLSSSPSYAALATFALSNSPFVASNYSTSFTLSHVHSLRCAYEAFSELSRFTDSKAIDCYVQVINVSLSLSSSLSSSSNHTSSIMTLNMISECWSTLSRGLAVIANMQIALAHHLTHPSETLFTNCPKRESIIDLPPEIQLLLPHLISSLSTLTNITLSLERGLFRDDMMGRGEGGREESVKEAMYMVNIRLYRLIDFIYMHLSPLPISSAIPLPWSSACLKSSIQK